MIETDSELADSLSAAVLGHEHMEEPDHLVLVRRAADASVVVSDLLRQAVSAARMNGHSWAAIGNVLGLSRQAVQQRFGSVANESAEGKELRRLGPVTALDELPELALAGRQGWRTVGAGMLYHLVERTDTQWETKRVVWRKLAKSYEIDGWSVAVRAFPWLYLVRDLGIPADPEPADNCAREA
ncbi:hypothetical protein [Granulicoccus sp. GXG6511]|uniref:hypothetical protein n=1 Tax=Granulicoccus sp. GXG6511 TaxID=3381351 RepID=UPI003D7D3C32